MIDNPCEISLLGSSEGPCGKLAVNVVPIDENGYTPEDEEFELIDEPSELLGKSLKFKIMIEKASNLPQRLANDVFVEFSLKMNGQIYKYKTGAVEGHNENPEFGFIEEFDVREINENWIELILSESLCFKVYGSP